MPKLSNPAKSKLIVHLLSMWSIKPGQPSRYIDVGGKRIWFMNSEQARDYASRNWFSGIKLVLD